MFLRLYRFLLAGITILFCLCAAPQAMAQPATQRNFDELYSVMNSSAMYDAVIIKKIDSVNSLSRQTAADNTGSQYLQSNALAEIYKTYKYDSAYAYALKSLHLAYAMGDDTKVSTSLVKLGFILLSSGLFKEANDSLKVIDASLLDRHMKVEYYTFRARYYYDLADYTGGTYFTSTYNQQGSAFLDSALAYTEPQSFSYYYYNGLRYIRQGNMADARGAFMDLLNRGGLTYHETAMATSTLSDIYIQKGDIDSAISLLNTAARADILSSTKETSAMYNLSQLLYKQGDIRNAAKFIEYAINDAAFYGARQRKVQLISVLPLIEAEKINQIETQKKILIGYSAIITLLLLAVIALAFTVYKQVRKLKAAQVIISEAHQAQSAINAKLAVTNDQLSEANRIKEEYIGYFFSSNTEFFNRMEKFKRLAEQKLEDRKLDEVRYLVNGINIRQEKEALLQNFDKAFLRLFPHFVEEFNKLFQPEDQVHLQDKESLNTDLRIFALIRVGIHDITKISQILEYSVNTINTYKTKVKNKSTLANEKFEQYIMKIPSGYVGEGA